jgi:hypothetical protein
MGWIPQAPGVLWWCGDRFWREAAAAGHGCQQTAWHSQHHASLLLQLPTCLPLSTSSPTLHLFLLSTPADDECAVDWAGIDFDPSDFGNQTNPLQRISLTLPPNHGMVAFTFVLRSEDGELCGCGMRLCTARGRLRPLAGCAAAWEQA